SGGTLSPGTNDTPSMIVMQSLQLQPDATLAINIQADGQADKVQVMESASLAGQVLAQAQDGDWQASTRYTILQADQGLGGTQFDSAGTNLPFLKPELSYDAQHVYLSMVRNETPLDDV